MTQALSFKSRGTIILGNHTHLKRPQISRLLEKAVHSPLVTVTAGAGYGKTVAVYSFLQDYSSEKIWIQISDFDNRSERFWENFTQSLAVRNPSFAARLAEIGLPNSKRQFEQYFNLLHRIFSPNKKYVFVFDDFHLLHNKSILEFINKLVEALFQNVSVILISRTEPETGGIGLLAKGLVCRINEEDLRFSKAEVLSFFKLQGIAISSRIQSKIYSLTGGWPFAIYLAGLALNGDSRRQDYALSAMKSNIFKLIETEILSAVSPKFQHFLIKLSLIEHLPLNLLLELSPDENCIAEIGKLSSFIRYDAYADTYRMHHLLLEYLRRRSDVLSPDEMREIYGCAARWCAANDCKIDAITYYEKAGDYKNLAREAYALTRMMPDSVSRFLLDVLDMVPDRAFPENVTLYIIRIKALQSLSRFEEASAQTFAVINAFEEEPPSAIHHWLLSECYFQLGFIGIFTSLHTGIWDYTDFFEKAYRHFELASETDAGLRERTLVASYVCRVGYPSAKGELDRGNEIFSGYAHYAEKAKNGMFCGMPELARCEAAYFKADLKNAEKLACQAVLKAQGAEQFQVENRALFFLLRINIHMGNSVKITSLLRQLEAQLENEAFLNSYVLYDIVIGWFFAQIGQLDKIPGWLKSDFEKSDLGTLSYGLESLVRAKYFFAEAKYHAVLAALENHGGAYGPEAFLLGKLEITILKAVCFYRTGNRDAAFQCLEEAYNISADDRLDMPFIELGRDMRTLAVFALKKEDCAIPREWLEKIRKKSSTYAKKLACVVSGIQNRNCVPGALTKKEADILKDMCHGLSRSEIAFNHNLSVNTVKAAIQIIYAKLGAQNIADAIRIAMAQKIID
jgi:LuxR family maltose regulon positive regulatory protein